jgi:hypothetical protein
MVMTEAEVITNNSILLEKRLTRLETDHLYMHDNIKDIKRGLRWLIGVTVSTHTTILGALAKGFNLI